MDKTIKICLAILVSSALFIATVILIRQGYFTVFSGNESYLVNYIAMLFIGFSTILIIFIGTNIGVNWKVDGIPISEKILYIVIYVLLGIIAPLVIIYEMIKAYIGEFALLGLLILLVGVLYLYFKTPKSQY